LPNEDTARLKNETPILYGKVKRAREKNPFDARYSDHHIRGLFILTTLLLERVNSTNKI
jgi:hypothetical protein